MGFVEQCDEICKITNMSSEDISGMVEAYRSIAESIMGVIKEITLLSESMKDFFVMINYKNKKAISMAKNRDLRIITHYRVTRTVCYHRRMMPIKDRIRNLTPIILH